MPIVRREEVELKVLARLVPHALAVHDHAQREIPCFEPQIAFEGTEVVRDPLPAALGGHPRLEADPLPERDLDSVPTAAAGEQPQHGTLEEGRVHAEFQHYALPEARASEAITSRKNSIDPRLSCTLPGRLRSCSTWPVCATCANSG